jgi:cell surface protein SprA
MLYAFLSAYSGRNAGTIALTPFQKIPIPNWRVNYNGLSNIKALKEIFSNISIKHAYSSILNIGSFYQPINYGTDTLTHGEPLITKYSYESGVTLVERLTPLLGIDVTTKEGISFRFEYKTDRSMTLNLRNLQMVEIRNKEWVIGGGYRATGVRLPFKYRGTRIVLKNDLNIRFDLSLRDGITVVRNIPTDVYTATSGIKTLVIRPTIDYKINDNLNLRMFYNRNVNTPYTSQSYPTAITDFGITLRYTLQ